MKSKVIIGKYIKQLLEEGKRVILPGFGNLQIKEVSGEVPTAGGRINPPGRSVRFDDKYSKDDGLLPSVYASGENIDPGEAEQQVLELVDAIRFALDKGEPYTVPDTGTFTRDGEGKVHFQTDPGWILEPEQFGLDSMDLLELEDVPAGQDETEGAESGEEDVTEKGEEKPAPEKARTKESVPSEEKVPEPPKSFARTGRRTRRWRVIWIITGVLILVLVLLIFIPVERTEEGKLRLGGEGILLRKKRPEPVEAPATRPEEGAGVQGEDAAGVQGEAGEAAPENVPAAEEPQQESLQEAGPEAGQADRYFIIAGSFRNLQNASEMQDQLKARGYPSEVMITDDRMYRVSVASYATKQKALRALEGIRAEPDLQNSWLLFR